ncbi:MAG: hypothetical protein L6V93_17635 [Clostridiales bacterium]|nr:MAG: hypothetical protein L6V93_17635 [Clostridiales bacterium]
MQIPFRAVIFFRHYAEKEKYTTVADAYYKPLKVFGVSVEISDESCPVTVSATTKSPGNIFFDGDVREFDVSFENKFFG